MYLLDSERRRVGFSCYKKSFLKEQLKLDCVRLVMEIKAMKLFRKTI